MANEVIETRSGKFWMGEHQTVRIVILPTADLTVADAKENLGAFARLCRGQRYPVLADIRNAKATNREERQLYTHAPEVRLITALALLVDSPLSRIIASFFLGINRLPCPTQVFTSEAKAIQWLHGFAEDNNETKEG